MRIAITIASIIVILVIARLCIYTVDAAEFAYVTVLGEHTETLDGANGGAGLHFGWPWPIQVVQRLDRRIQQFDLQPTEHLFPDAQGKTVDKPLSVEAYVVWKITDREAVDRFIRRIGSAEKAQAILATTVNGQLGASFGKMKMDDIVNTDEARINDAMQKWHASFLANLSSKVQSEYGIDLVDIRLRRFNYLEKTRDAIFERIKSERQTKAADYQAEGKLRAANITSQSEEQARKILAESLFQAEVLKSQADREAIAIRNEAHNLDPKFYAYIKEMEKLQSILSDNRTVLLLSTHRALFKMLFEPPQPGNAAPPAPVQAPKKKAGD